MATESQPFLRPGTRELWPFGSGRVLVFGAFAVPAAVFYIRLTESYALGMTFTILALLMYHAVFGVERAYVQPVRLLNAGRASIVLLLLVLLHLGLAASFQEVDLGRAVPSVVLLLAMLLASATMAEILLNLPERRFDDDMRILFVLMLVIALIGLTGFGPPPLRGDAWRRPFFPFAEPAGFALPFCPFFIYACVTARGGKRWGLLLLGAAALALLHTLTLAVAVALAAAVSLRKRQLLFFTLFAVAGLTQLNLEYYTERLDFGAETTNLSTLVYMQGWQMLLESLENSGGFGLGFQQMGVFGTEVSAAEAIRAMRGGEDLNVLDGGFIFAKLGSEFGVFGVLVTLGFVVGIYKSMRALRNVARRDARLGKVDILAHAVIATFVIHLFVRSGGYFTGEMLVTFVALWILNARRVRVREPADPVSAPAAAASTQ